jgi:hypothetical protein
MSVVTGTEKHNYMLTVRYRFEAMDDVEARKEAQAILPQNTKDAEVKLQEFVAGQPPRGVNFQAS